MEQQREKISKWKVERTSELRGECKRKHQGYCVTEQMHKWMGEWCDERVGKYIEGKYCEKWKHELSNWSNYKWWVNS